MTTFMMSITTAIFALKIKCFLIAQQIEMAIVNTKAVDIFAVIVPRNLNAQKAKILEKRGWNTARFLLILKKIKRKEVLKEKWCWA